MNNITLRSIETADKSELSALQSSVFDDYERSNLLSEVVAVEAAARPAGALSEVQSLFGVAAFRNETLVGWSQGYRQGRTEFYMLNSGVVGAERRKGIYSQLVKAILDHATSLGYSKVMSRHAAANSAVIIAKLRLGFHVSGFEYSEVYGPLVQLTYFVNEARKRLYLARAVSIRSSSQ